MDYEISIKDISAMEKCMKWRQVLMHFFKNT